MSDRDDQARTTARAGADIISTYLAHFTRPDATWESFDKVDFYLETLRLNLMETLFAVESELQARAAVEPVDYGS